MIPGANLKFVQHVLSMDTVATRQRDGGPRAYSIPSGLADRLLVDRCGGGADGRPVLLWEPVELWRARRSNARIFHEAKRLRLSRRRRSGLLIWFVGFTADRRPTVRDAAVPSLERPAGGLSHYRVDFRTVDVFCSVNRIAERYLHRDPWCLTVT